MDINESKKKCPKCLGTGTVSIYFKGRGAGIPCPKCNEERESSLSKELKEMKQQDDKPGVKEVIELSRSSN